MDKDRVRLSMRVQPRASRDEIAGVGADGVLKVRVCAPPVEGAANERLIGLMARQLRIPKSNIVVAAGGTSRNKVVEVRGAGEDAQEVLRRLLGN